MEDGKDNRIPEVEEITTLTKKLSKGIKAEQNSL